MSPDRPQFTIKEDIQWGYFIYDETGAIAAFCGTLWGARWKAARMLRKRRRGLRQEIVREAEC